MSDANAIVVAARSYYDKLTEEQVRALPMLAHGATEKQIADMMNLRLSEIQAWFKDPAFSAALTDMASEVENIHTRNLNIAADLSWERVFELLKDDSEISERLKKEQISLAKFVISELGLKVNRQDIRHQVSMSPEMHVDESSADIIAQRLYELQNPDKVQDEISDGEYKIIDLPEEVACHPSAEFGIVTVDNGSSLCHICGKWEKDLIEHIWVIHAIRWTEYKRMFGIDENLTKEDMIA